MCGDVRYERSGHPRLTSTGLSAMHVITQSAANVWNTRFRGRRTSEDPTEVRVKSA